MNSVCFQKITDVPMPPRGYVPVTRSVASDGSLLFLSIEVSGLDAVRERYQGGIGSFPKTRMAEAKLFSLSIVSANDVRRTISLPRVDVTFPNVDMFPDGRVLVAGARSSWRSEDDYDRNGAIFDPRTGEMRRFLLGDGINSLAIDAIGRIWVAYGDEGIFGNFGWGNPGPMPIGSAGLVCFSDSGTKIWEYPADDRMADCYALNVSAQEASIFFYTDFPICRVSSDFKLTYWATNLRGCQHLAISGTSVLFTGQYDDPPDVGYTGKLAPAQLTDIQQIKFVLSDGKSISQGDFIGRGKYLYFVDELAVYRVRSI
jgi:hypothetical protein